MSKYVKDLVTKDLKKRLDGVEEAVFVNMIGVEANHAVSLRKDLRDKNIQLMVVKNSLARRATEGSLWPPPWESARDLSQSCGAPKTSSRSRKKPCGLQRTKTSQHSKPVAESWVRKRSLLIESRRSARWPSRDEQLSILSGQILGPGRTLAAALIGPGGTLAGQIEKKSKDGE